MSGPCVGSIDMDSVLTIDGPDLSVRNGGSFSNIPRSGMVASKGTQNV